MQNAGTWDSLVSKNPRPAQTDRSAAPTPIYILWFSWKFVNMKNTYFLIIALLVGVCINPLPGFCSDQPPKVRKMHWGMTPEEVQKQEKGETAGKTLLYHVEFAEFPTIVEYVFTENRLVEITFYSRYKKERYQEDLKTLVAHLSKMYGEPVKKNRWAAEQTLIILSKIKAGWMLRFIYKEEQS